MKKRVLTLFLALAMCFGLAVPAFAADEPPTSGTCGENLTWALKNGILTINGSGTMMEIGAINPPPWYESVDSITSIQIGNGVTSIGENAFEGCYEVTSVTIPNSVTNIGGYAFCGCGMTSVTIPNNVTSIGPGAFSNCTGLTSVTIPNNVAGIDGKTFLGCTGLTNITIGKGVTIIGQYALGNCTGLTSVTIPGSVTDIGGGAFSGCTRLTSVTIGDGVTHIWEGAFFDCTGLTNVTIPSNVTEIGEEAFEGCDNLTIHGKAGSYAERYAKENNIPFVAIGSSDPTPAPAFTDTPAWCAKEAQWAVEQGITNGAGGATTFAPTLECTHDQILTFLWRAEGKPAAAKAPVTAASYYQDAIDWAYEKGFIDNSFQPSAPCTRAQAVWYIWKALGEPNASKAAAFTDVDAGADYAAAVSWAVEKGVTKGYGGEDTFAPDRVCGRGEIVCFLHRAYTLWGIKNVPAN